MDPPSPVDRGPSAARDLWQVRRRARRRTRQQARRSRAEVLFVIAVGGMLGASARYGLARLVPTHGGGFPWATFLTNLSGTFVLGWLLALLERFPQGRLIRSFVATGIIGAFTTMSTYAVETAMLIARGQWVTAFAYGLGSLGCGLALCYTGIRVGRSTPADRQSAVLVLEGNPIAVPLFVGYEDIEQRSAG